MKVGEVMVYMKCGDAYADGDYNLLKDFLILIDAKIEELNKIFHHTKDEYILDSIEYYVGFGYIAIQRYFHSTYPQTFTDKSKALSAYPSDLMLVLNAGANFVKHSEEWPLEQSLKAREQKTMDTFLGGDDLSDYPCSNKLFALTQSMSFIKLIPKIEEWRNILSS